MPLSRAPAQYQYVTPTGSSVSIALADILGSVQHPGLYNFRPDNLKKWRKALANVLAGVSNARLAFIGDSTTAGWGGGTGTNGLTGARAKAFPRYVAATLNGFVPAQDVAVWGDANLGGTYVSSAYDPRMALGSGWSLNANSLGGLMFFNNSTTNALSATLAEQVDTFDVYYVQASSNATFTINVDGGAALATVNADAANTVAKRAVTTTLGTHTLNIARNGTGNSCFIIGIDAYDSSKKKVSVWNMGHSGSLIANWASTSSAWSHANALPVTSPDLTVINVGINDWDQGTSVASFKTNYQTVIDKSKLSGDVILTVPVPSSVNNATLAEQAAIVGAIYDLAALNDAPVIDLTQRLGSHADANSLGLYYDALHPNALGYADVARIVAKALLV